MSQEMQDSLIREVSEWARSMGVVFDTVAHLYAEVPLTREEFMETAEKLAHTMMVIILNNPELMTERRMEYMFDRTEDELFNRHPLPDRWKAPLEPEIVH
jgi:hypothetical protein